MAQQQETLLEKIIYYLIIYILPVSFVLYVNYTKCFPYSFARWLWKGTRYKNSPHVHDGFLYGVGLLTCGGIYWLVINLVGKKNPK